MILMGRPAAGPSYPSIGPRRTLMEPVRSGSSFSIHHDIDKLHEEWEAAEPNNTSGAQSRTNQQDKPVPIPENQKRKEGAGQNRSGKRSNSRLV